MSQALQFCLSIVDNANVNQNVNQQNELTEIYNKILRIRNQLFQKFSIDRLNGIFCFLLY